MAGRVSTGYESPSHAFLNVPWGFFLSYTRCFILNYYIKMQ